MVRADARPVMIAVLMMQAASVSGSSPELSRPPVDVSAPDSIADGAVDIVVTGRRNGARRRLDAVDQYRRYCFDANRRTGRSLEPKDDGDWSPLDAAARTRFGVTDPSVPAYGLGDPARGQTLLLKIERFDRPEGLVESRCTLVVIGGPDHSSLASRMSGVFGAAGTGRHVGAADGSPRIRGWRQWLWTGMPGRRSKSWKSIGAGDRTGSDTWLVVSDPKFYDDYDYILGDLKTRTAPGIPLSVLSFAYVTRSRGR